MGPVLRIETTPAWIGIHFLYQKIGQGYQLGTIFGKRDSQQSIIGHSGDHDQMHCDLHKGIVPTERALYVRGSKGRVEIEP